MNTSLAIGDRVRFSGNWLRNIGAYTGPLGQLVGTVIAIREYKTCPSMVTVDWDHQYFDTKETNVLATNLQRTKR